MFVSLYCCLVGHIRTKSIDYYHIICKKMIKKTTILLLVALATASVMVSCSSNDAPAQGKKGSSGKTLEMMLVTDKTTYSGATKMLIDSLFRCPQEGFFTPEPIFDVVTIPPSSFNNTEMFQAHRNIVICDINPNNPNKVYKSKDKWAAPQVVYDFAVKDRQTLDSFLAKYASMMIDDMRMADRRRVIKAFASTKGVEVMNRIEENFGFSLTVSSEFEVAKMTDDFAWIRKETKDFGIGVLVNTMPYESKAIFDEEEILRNLDAMMKQHVPGPAENSYMGTERRVDVARRQVTMADQYCIETRGMWRTFGDFMGGPYVNYTLLAPDQKTVVMLTGYVYAPRSTKSTPYPKRDYLMQADGICWSIKF